MFELTAGRLQLDIYSLLVNVILYTDRYVGNEGIYVVFTLQGECTQFQFSMHMTGGNICKYRFHHITIPNGVKNLNKPNIYYFTFLYFNLKKHCLNKYVNVKYSQTKYMLKQIHL